MGEDSGTGEETGLLEECREIGAGHSDPAKMLGLFLSLRHQEAEDRGLT